ncbi:MAG: 50S rRNA methyltransferase [Deltaproteobacteria bacterium]|nr:MAG: 50S rRNA methyltransferase [Deltaproteobacteria bacterium]
MRSDYCSAKPIVLMKKDRWQDHYARQAKEKGWLARSVFKLEEIDTKYHLIRPRSRVLDLGCYPGSWSQYALSKVGPRGEVIGIDLVKPEQLKASNFRFYQADVLTLEADQLKSLVGQVNTVLSDLAPRTSGIKEADAARSMELAEKALEIALSLLIVNGSFLCKVFECQELEELRSRISQLFRASKAIRPKAVRKGSREIYLVGRKRIIS